MRFHIQSFAIFTLASINANFNLSPTIIPDWGDKENVIIQGLENYRKGNEELATTSMNETTDSSSNMAIKDNDKLPDGATLGFCPDGVDGQNVTTFTQNASLRGSVDIDETPEGRGNYTYYCYLDMEEVSAEPIVISVSAQDFQRLPLRGSGIVLEPDREDYIIRLPVIALTDPSPQVLTTTILGVGVAIRATPIEYSWDFGDQTPALITTDPGRSYPDQTVEHLYTQLGQFTITLTTTWEGEFSIDGGTTWLPINGTTTTTNTTNPITIEERVPLLTG